MMNERNSFQKRLIFFLIGGVMINETFQIKLKRRQKNNFDFKVALFRSFQSLQWRVNVVDARRIQS